MCVATEPRGFSAEDLQGMCELGGLRGLEGRSAGAGSACPPQREPSDHSLEVWSGLPRLHPPLLC